VLWNWHTIRWNFYNQFLNNMLYWTDWHSLPYCITLQLCKYSSCYICPQSSLYTYSSSYDGRQCGDYRYSIFSLQQCKHSWCYICPQPSLYTHSSSYDGRQCGDYTYCILWRINFGAFTVNIIYWRTAHCSSLPTCCLWFLECLVFLCPLILCLYIYIYIYIYVCVCQFILE